MEFYKKNPKIEGTITVQKVLLDDDMVVTGEEFRIFANPKTFPSIPVRLVAVDFDSLTETQKERAIQFAKERGQPAPRHLGVIKSENFELTRDGAFKIHSQPKKPSKQAPAPVLPPKKAEPKLTQLYNLDEFIDIFPGITDRNARQVRRKFLTVKSLAEASNADLRAVGVRSNFFKRLRDRANLEMEQGDE